MISRRRFVDHSLLASVASALFALTSSRAAAMQLAQAQVAQAQVAYQNQPNGAQRCEVCSHFQRPNACKLVSGTISPQGWCRLFSARA